MKIIILLSIFFAAISCNNEDDLIASYADKNYYVLSPSDDPVENIMYQLYDKWGIPIFVSDTLGKEMIGVDEDGNSVFRYELLDLDYTLDRLPLLNVEILNTKFSLIKEDDIKIAGAHFLDKYFLPNLPKGIYCHSIFMTDTLVEHLRDGIDSTVYVHEGMTTLAIGSIPKIVEMSVKEKQKCVNHILEYLAVSYLYKRSELLADFYMKSSDSKTLTSYYDKNVSISGDGVLQLKMDHYEVYGFLRPSARDEKRLANLPFSSWTYYRCPKKDQDLEDFVNAAFVYGPAEFEEKYMRYSIVLDKYEIIRGLLLSLGYKLK